MKKEEMNIEDLIKILDKNNLTELNYEEAKLKITIKKPLVARASEVPTKVISDTKEAARGTAENKEQVKEIVSNGIGRFFYKTANGENIISLGEHIKVGQEIGYVTTVGVKNIVNSTIAGEITEICVENGGIVDYGKILLKVKSKSK